MRSEETVIQIFGREMKVEIEGLTPMEVSALAGQVTDKMKEVQQLSGTADSSKLAMLACLHFAAELSQLQERSASSAQIDEKRLDGVLDSLKHALEG